MALAACTTTGSGTGVHKAPAAAGADAVLREALPISVALPTPAPTCTNAPPGWFAAELSRPGVADVRRMRAQATFGPVNGYLDTTTAVCGQRLAVHLASHPPQEAVRLRALRIGDYHGEGSRLVWQSGVLTTRHQPQAEPAGPDRVVLEHWPTTTTLDINAQWPPGFYLIEVVPIAHPRQASYIPLVVRTSGVHSPYVMVASDLTWEAYNGYGGRSLYFGPGHDHTEQVANRSYVASTHRPYSGSGLQQVLATELPLVRFLARHRFATDLTTVSSLDASPLQLDGARTVILGGHSEYWTRRAYDALVAARDHGTNLAFLGANEVYWQGRIERDAAGLPTALTVYRTASLDTLAREAPQTTTVEWRDPLLHRDPATVVGEGMSTVGAWGSYVVRTTPPWLFAGTGLRAGDVLPRAVGNEADAVEAPGLFSPRNEQVVLESVVHPLQHPGPALVTAGYYAAPSGAGVFAAGTTYWVCELDGSCPLERVPSATSALVNRLTLNLLTAFGEARFGLRHPSHAVPYLPSTVLALTLGSMSRSPIQLGGSGHAFTPRPTPSPRATPSPGATSSPSATPSPSATRSPGSGSVAS